MSRYIHRKPVDSDAVASIGYDRIATLLDIEFTGGDVYRYEAVPPEQARALMATDSIGRYVNEWIKPRYKFSKLGKQ